MPSKNVFFDLRIGKDGPHRIEFELFTETTPKTVLNFLEFCRGTKVEGKVLSYKNSIFHRVVKDFMIQGGDILNGDGTGRVSIYGKTFPDENFKLRHDKPYLLSMANSGVNSNGCQFFITCVPCPHLDGKHVVFGKVIKGQKIVDRIENVQVDNKTKPLADVTIVNCGELKLGKKDKTDKKTEKRKRKASASSSSSSSSDSDSDSDSDSSSSSSSSDSGDEKNTADQENKQDESGIKISDIPDVPAEKNFLYRSSKTPERKRPEEGDGKVKDRDDKRKTRKKDDHRRSRSRSHDRRRDRRRDDGRHSRRSRSRSKSPWRANDRFQTRRTNKDLKVRGRGVSMLYASVVRNEEPLRWKYATSRTQKFSEYIKKVEGEAEQKDEVVEV